MLPLYEEPLFDHVAVVLAVRDRAHPAEMLHSFFPTGEVGAIGGIATVQPVAGEVGFCSGISVGLLRFADLIFDGC